LLERLGPEASIELQSNLASFCEEIESEALDLMVLDCDDAKETRRWLDYVGNLGPPVLVVLRDDDEETALEAFRCGASQCVQVGADYAHLLPAAALELIHHWQRQRERGKVERRIRWLEDLNDAVVSRIPAALIVIDVEGRIVTINPEGSRLLSLTESEAIGNEFARVCPADLYRDGGFAEILAVTRGGKDVPARRAHWKAKGNVREMVAEIRGQRLNDEGRVLLVLTDVTELESQTEQIGELQRYNENIIQNINSALLVVNTDREISFANPTAESILGVESGKLIGRRIADWFRDHETEENLIDRTLVSGARFKGAECLIQCENGRVIPVGISCSPLLDRDGEALGAVAIFQDLSEIKLLERQMLQSEKMASIGQLAAGVAHEINNPVGFIHANLFQVSEYLQDLEGVWDRLDALQNTIEKGAGLEEIREASGLLSKVCREIDLDYVKRDFVKAVAESQEGSERIRHIVRDLRDFSRQDTGEATLADVNQCIDSTAHIVWTMMKHVVILKKNYAELPPLRCYPMQLEQVLMNLLVNACQAIEEKVGEEGTTGEVEVQTVARNGGVAIIIRDNGVGIPSEDLGKIFDPFFTTKDVGAGTGLGLSTSYSLIQRHGGEIKVESVVGEGTTFEIWLPGSLEAESRVVR
jgi:PAS domain S-box-containing protein